MFDLFGAEMPLAVRFFLAFLIVLGLMGAAAWAVRQFGSARLSGAVRGRQPQLAVIEYATVDARRRLLLVRRDNVEHLMMIGGPTDVVVEANIVRAAPAAVREPAAPRIPAPGENLARAIPLPEATSNGSWPLQPEAPVMPVQPPAPARRGPRIEPMSEEPVSAAPPHAEPIPRPQREALTALADDLSAVIQLRLRRLHRCRRAAVPRRRLALQPAEPRSEHRAEPPRLPAGQPAADPGAADQSLAEMAQRLEAALRKPKTAELRAPSASAAGSRRRGASRRTDRGPFRRHAPHARPRRSPRAPKLSRKKAKHFTTPSNRRWPVYWAARQTKPDDIILGLPRPGNSGGGLTSGSLSFGDAARRAGYQHQSRSRRRRRRPQQAHLQLIALSTSLSLAPSSLVMTWLHASSLCGHCCARRSERRRCRPIP